MRIVKLLLLTFGLLTINVSEYYAQSFEQMLTDYIADAPNAFNNAYTKYGKDCYGNCNEVLVLTGEIYKGKATYYISFILAAIDSKGRKALHEKFQSYRKQIKNVLSDWEKDSKIEFFYGKDTYSKQEGDDKKEVTIELQNFGGYDLVILKIKYKGLSTTKIANKVSFDPFNFNPVAKNTTKKKEPEPTEKIVEAEPLEPFEILSTKDGKQEFLNLLKLADSEFKSVKIKTDEKNQWKLKTTILNPEADEPYQVLRQTSPMRLELDIFLEPKYMSNTFGSEALTETLEDILKPKGWKIYHKGRNWIATPSNNSYTRLVKKVFSGNAYLVLEVVKKEYRKQVDKYPLLRIADCLEGDCINGFGSLKYLDEDSLYRYEGKFKDGKFDGLGFLYARESKKSENPKPKYFGYFSNGKKNGYGISLEYVNSDKLWRLRKESDYFKPSDEVMLKGYYFQEYENGVLMSESEVNWLHYSPQNSNKTYLITTPFSLEFGNAISGNCKNGNGVLNLPNLGKYKGRFVDGRAEGYGELTLPNKEVKAFFAINGIPKYIKTLVLPLGVSRLAAAKRGAFQLATDDCLEGNCKDGNGIAMMGSADRFSVGQYDIEGYYVGGFKNGKFNGYGEMHPFSSESTTVSGKFEMGLRQGLFVRKSDDKTEKLYYKDNIRVTESGKLWAEYLKEDLELRKTEIQKLINEGAKENAVRVAAIDRRNAERKRRAAEEAKKARSQTRRRGSRGTLIYEATFRGSTYSIPAFLETDIYVQDINGGSNQVVKVGYLGDGGWLDYEKYNRFQMNGGIVHFRFNNDTGVNKKFIIRDPRSLGGISPHNKYSIQMGKSSTYRVLVYER
jgi:hypothetical protein